MLLCVSLPSALLLGVPFPRELTLLSRPPPSPEESKVLGLKKCKVPGLTSGYFFFFFNLFNVYFYLFIWLHLVLLATCEI